MKLASGVSVDTENGWISFPESVSVIARLEGRLVLVSQQRPNFGSQTLELPGGKIESDESTIAAANRELAEEAGLKGQKATVHLSLDMDHSASFHRTHLIEVFGVTETGTNYELEREVVNMAQARELVLNGKITHAPTVVAILGFLK
jgi:ADP-ribose pyrophosphatase